MSESSKCLGFYLSDSLTGNIKIQANLFKCQWITVIETETHSQNFLFTRRKSRENFGYLLLQKHICSLGCGILHILILNEVGKKTVFFLTNRSFKRNGFS